MIESRALSSEIQTLRAFFSQINAEVRKKGVILSADEGSFYVSKRFTWAGTVRDFFDAYHRICERKQVSPLYQEAALSTSLKVPFASLDTINLLHGGVYKRLMQFKKALVPPFSKLADKPTIEDLRRVASASSDNDIRDFLELVILVDEELREYVRQLDELVSAYQEKVAVYKLADSGGEDERTLIKRDKALKQRVLAILGPYISKLKRGGYIASSWEYSFKDIPMTDEAARFLGKEKEDFYWNSDVLPLPSTRKARQKRLQKMFMKARKLEAKEKKKKEKERAKAKKASVVHLSGPSLWYRFDKRITRIGNGIAERMDAITDWLMTASIWIAIIWAALIVIATLISEGIIAAIIVLIIGAAIIGFLQGLAGILALMVKYVAYIPLYALRIIFYRGWTMALTLLGIIGFVTYKLLEKNSIIF